MTGVIIKKSKSLDKSYFLSPAFLLNTSPIKRNKISKPNLFKKIGVFLGKSPYRTKKTFRLIKNYLKDALKIDNSSIDESRKVVYRKNSTESMRSNESPIYHSSLSSLSSSEDDSFLSAIKFKFDEPLDKKERIVSTRSQLRDNDYWLAIENRYSKLEEKSILHPEMIPALKEIRGLMESLEKLEKRFYSPEGEKQGAQLTSSMSLVRTLLSDKLNECEQKYLNKGNHSSLASSESKVSEKNTIKPDRAMPEPVYQDVNFSSPDISGYDHLDHFRTNSPLLSKNQADYKSLNSIPLSPNQENSAEGEKKSPVYENINRSLFFKSLATGRLLPIPSNSQKIYQEKIMDSFDKSHNFFSKSSLLQKLHDERSITLSSRPLTAY